MKLFSKSKTTPLHTILKLNLPNDRWYIAGGSLLKDTGDIDVYFLDEQAYNEAKEHMGKPDYSSKFADTYIGSELFSTDIQFISKHFGSPKDILASFDLNKSRQAQYPDGTIYRHPTFHYDLYVDTANISYNTITRLRKYQFGKDQPLDVAKFNQLIDYLVDHHQDDVAHYYDSGTRKMTRLINDMMGHYFFAANRIMAAIDRQPIEDRHTLYKIIIRKDTHILPMESMSIEQQLYTSLKRAKQYEVHHLLTGSWPDYIRIAANIQPSQAALETYPEYFV